jgi:hypothetical protein
MLLTRAVEDDRIGALERKRAELLERRRELREAGAPPAKIVPVVEELDRVEAELRAVPAPVREEDDELRWKDALLVGAASVVVAAVATGAAALAFGSSSSSGATTDDTVVRVRLHSALAASRCSATAARARLTWTWTVESSGHDGEVATIHANGPGLASAYRVRVDDGRVRLARTTPCEPFGTVWKVTLARVGSTPTELSH